MASRIAGITVEIDGDTTGLTKALSSVNTSIKSTSSQLKDVEKLLKLDPTNTELLAQKQKLLAEAVEETKEKLETLKTASEQANQALEEGTISQEQYDALQREIIETEEKLKDLEEQAEQSATAIQEIAASGEKLQDLGDSISSVGTKMLGVTTTVVALGTAAVTTAAEFDSAMSKVEALITSSSDNIEADMEMLEAAETAWEAITEVLSTAWEAISSTAQTQEEIEAMANGSTALAIYSEDDIETYRDVLYYTAQVLGGFFVINREGKLELRKYSSDAVMEITQEQRFSSSFSDFITRYTAISSTNERTETAEYYSVDPDDALTMNLGVNPLLQFGLTETREYLLTSILEDLQEVNYVPFDSETIGNPALDLGDILVFSGGSADETQITCITSIQYNIGGRQALKCVGKNPRLSSAKSKNDKNIAGLLSQIEEGQIGIYTYTNASAFTIGSTDVEIIAMEFTAQEETDAQFIAQVMIEVDTDTVTKTATASGTITVPLSDSSDSDSSDSSDSDTDSSDDSSYDDSSDSTDSESSSESSSVTVDVSLPVTWTEDGEAIAYVTYEYNDETITLLQPVETWHSGKHILTLYYPLDGVAASVASYFSVYLRLEGGSGKVAIGGCIASVSGQSLGGTYDWDGEITGYETVSRFDLVTSLTGRSFTEEIGTEAIGEKSAEFTQGNGTIAAVALTSAQGGCGGFGSTVDDTSMLLVMSYLSDSSVDSDMKKLLFEAVEADFENNTVVCIDYTSSAVTISKVRIPILSIGLNELIDDTTAEIIETYTITCSTFAPSSTYHCFLDGGDGYWYGLGNSANSSGDATLKWIKISKDDYSYEEGSYTLSDVTLVYAGSRSYSSYPSNRTKSVMRDGYAYIPSYDLTGVYKINIGNEADISLIELEFITAFDRLIMSIGSV